MPTLVSREAYRKSIVESKAGRQIYFYCLDSGEEFDVVIDAFIAGRERGGFVDDSPLKEPFKKNDNVDTGLWCEKTEEGENYWKEINEY